MNPGQIIAIFPQFFCGLPDCFQSDTTFSVFRHCSDTARSSDVYPVVCAHVIQNAEGDDFALIKGAEEPIAGVEVSGYLPPRREDCKLMMATPGSLKTAILASF